MSTGLTTSITHDRVAVSWDDPGGDSTMGYQVLRRPVDGDEYGDGRSAPGFVAVTDDTGSVSTTKSATVVLTGAVRTERPRTLTATATGGTVVLTWEMPQGWGYTNYYDTLRSRPELGEVIPLKRSTRFTNGQTTYTYTDVEPGVLYVYRVRGADFLGTPRDASEPIEIRTPQEAPPHNRPATGAPAITGTVKVGHTLVADMSEIYDADGLTAVEYSYHWMSYDGSEDTDIQGATCSTYTLVQADEHMVFKVKVLFTDDAGNKQLLTSEPAYPVKPSNLSASESDDGVVLSWDVPMGWPHWPFFQIRRSRPDFGEPETQVLFDLTFSTDNTYIDRDVEPGVLYLYRVKGVDPVLLEGEVSEPVEIRTGEPTPAGNRLATGAPTMHGTVQVGETLTADASDIADADGLTGEAFRYQWVVFDGNIYTDIQDVTDTTYTPRHPTRERSSWCEFPSRTTRTTWRALPALRPVPLRSPR